MASFGELLGAEILEAREEQRLTQLVLAQEVFDDENYVRRIGDYETGKVARPQAKVYRPICDFLGITSQTIGALKAKATDAKTVTDDELLALRTEKGSLEQALSDLQGTSRGLGFDAEQPRRCARRPRGTHRRPRGCGAAGAGR